MSQAAALVPPEPVSKRRQQRATNRRINTAATEANAALRAHIEVVATEMGVPKDDVFQRFTLISPVGEQRLPMWWNGLIAEKSSEWKQEYVGPGRQYLSWVAQQIREKGLAHDLTDEEKTRYAELAAKTRAKNKDSKTTGLTRKQAVTSAQDDLVRIHNQLETLHNKLGLQYMLVTTRGKLEDNMAPLYASSDKVDTFLQGHMNMPMKDLLTHLDFYVIGKEATGVTKIQGKKQALRSSVRTRLKNSLSNTLEKIGINPSTISCVKYANYDKMVYDYRIVLVGYPVTSNGRQMVRPSDFPGGIKGLMHADNKLASEVWRFEELPADSHNEWKLKYDKAMAYDTEIPPAPYIPVPGSEFKKGSVDPPTTEDSGVSRNDSCKRKAPKAEMVAKAKRKNGKVKSREIIHDSESEAASEPPEDDSDGERSSTTDSDGEDD
ncbi:hypothetical protein RhiTH_003229 [Rhizoctonia solani]